MIFTFFLYKLINQKKINEMLPMLAMFFSGSFFRWPWSLEPQMLWMGWGLPVFQGSNLMQNVRSPRYRDGGDHCCLGWGGGLLLFFQAALFGLLIYDLTPWNCCWSSLEWHTWKTGFLQGSGRKKTEVVCWPISTLFKIFGGFLLLRHPHVLKIQRW